MRPLRFRTIANRCHGSESQWFCFLCHRSDLSSVPTARAVPDLPFYITQELCFTGSLLRSQARLSCSGAGALLTKFRAVQIALRLRGSSIPGTGPNNPSCCAFMQSVRAGAFDTSAAECPIRRAVPKRNR